MRESVDSFATTRNVEQHQNELSDHSTHLSRPRAPIGYTILLEWFEPSEIGMEIFAGEIAKRKRRLANNR